MIIFDVDDMELTRKNFDWQGFQPLHVWYTCWKCDFCFVLHYSGSDAMGGGLAGRTTDKTNDGTIMGD